MKYVIVIFLFAMLSVSCQQQFGERQPVESDDYLIYSLLLNQLEYPRNDDSVKQFVIAEMTLRSDKNCDPARRLETANTSLAAEVKSAIADLEKKVKTSIPLSKKFSLKKNYVLISQGEVLGILTSSFAEWDKKYPNSSGIISLSRVGYSADKTIAVVYRTVACSGRCGEGAYYIFEKKDGRWNMKEFIGCWII